jgi:rod shape-determining protein MreD
MAVLSSYDPRRELVIRRYPLQVYTLVPLVALVIQAWLPRQRYMGFFAFVDLPLVVTIYFALGRRSPIQGTLLGCVIGLLQDALTHQAIGLNGITKTVVGYLAASVGVRIDEGSLLVRVVLSVVLSLLSGVMYLFIFEQLLGLEKQWIWWTEILRGVGNAALALALYPLLDRLQAKD